jgi:two-component system, NarL family, sensor histidine kinase UhpB
VNNPVREQLVDEYAVAFEAYLSEPAEFALLRAYELGRSALSRHMGVLDIATVHSRVLAAVLDRPLPGGDSARLLEASEKFFVEALSPFEMAHRGFGEANAVLRRLNDMLEAQSKRIASALHDEAAQLLVPLHLGLVDVARKVPADVAQEIQVMRGLLDSIEERLRNLSHELRPPILDDLGLVPALEFLSDSISKRWGLRVSVEATIDGGLPATIETTLYRITREALTNVAKHARARQAHVSLLRASHAIVCSIRDDGIGFDTAAGVNREGRRGIGLSDIKERVTALGGILRLGPNGDRGTALTVEIPLES